MTTETNNTINNVFIESQINYTLLNLEIEFYSIDRSRYKLSLEAVQLISNSKIYNSNLCVQNFVFVTLGSSHLLINGT